MPVLEMVGRKQSYRTGTSVEDKEGKSGRIARCAARRRRRWGEREDEGES